jgi:hypothetical protein
MLHARKALDDRWSLPTMIADRWILSNESDRVYRTLDRMAFWGLDYILRSSE